MRGDGMQVLNTTELIESRLSELATIPHFPNDVPNEDERLDLHNSLEAQLSVKPTNTQDLELRLRICGMIIRRLNTTMGANGMKVKPVSEADAANIILNLMTVKRVGDVFDDNTPLMIYSLEDGIYAERNVDLGRLTNIIEPSMKEMGRKETRSRVIQNCGFGAPTRDENIAVLGNGLFNVKTQKLMPFTPDKIFLSKASVNWNPEAVCPDFDGWSFDAFLDEQFNGEKEAKYAIYQMLQMALLTNKAKRVFVYFYSLKGRTGKGTLTELIRQLVGPQNSGSANIEQLEQTFGLESVYNKAFIYGNENDNVFAKSSVNIKNLATGDSVTVNRKSIVNLSVCATPLIIQSMNTTPVFRGLDGGTKNRMRVLEFTHSYYEDDNEDVKNVYVKDKAFLEYLAHKVLTMPVNLMIDPKSSRDIKQSIEMESNSVLEWFVEMFDEFKGTEFATAVLFDSFRAWLKQQNKRDNMSQITFAKRFKSVSQDILTFVPKNMKPDMADEDLKMIDTMLVQNQLLLPSDDIVEHYNLKTKQQSGFIKNTTSN